MFSAFGGRTSFLPDAVHGSSTNHPHQTDSKTIRGARLLQAKLAVINIGDVFTTGPEEEMFGGDGLVRQAAPVLAECDALIPVLPRLPPIHRVANRSCNPVADSARTCTDSVATTLCIPGSNFAIALSASCPPGAMRVDSSASHERGLTVLSALRLIVAYVLINPYQDQVGNLEIVFVKHEHVTVTVDAQVRRKQHLSITTCSIDASDEGLAIIEGVLPGQSDPGVCVKMITKQDQDRDGRQR